MKAIVKVAVLLMVLGLVLSTSALAAGPGADTFKAKCAMCHGADGSGNTVMGKKFGLKDLGSAEVQKMTDAQITEIITKGKEKMPAYGGKLSAEEIKNLVAFIRTLKK
jgi:cytochrome c6